MTKARILVVEDEAIIAMEIENSLQNLGYETTSVVNTGDKALQKAEEDKPDLILMDIRIQGDKDGIEIAKIIRNKFGIPVVFSTAYLEEEKIEQAKITMPFGYVLKPIQERDLKVTLEMALYVAKVDSERKKIEQELRESKALFQTAMDQSQAGIAIADAPDGKLRYVNDAGLGIRGKAKEEIVDGIGIEQYVESWQILHLDGTPYKPDEVPLARAVIYGETNSKEFIIRRQDDEDRIVLANAAPILNNKGKITAGMVVFLDITERKKAEEALRESEEKHRTLFETMTQGVVYQNAKGIITDANPAAERILGLSLNQMQGKTSMDPRWKAIHEDGSDFPGENHPIPVALRTGKPVKNVIHGVFHPDNNEYRWIRVNAVPKFRKGESKPYEAYAIFDDITDERERKK